MTPPRDARGRFVKLLETPQAITAAAAVYTSSQLDRKAPTIEGWQERAWRLWRILGVLHYPTTFMAEQVQRVKWDVVVNGEPLEPEDAEKAIAAVTQPIGIAEATRRLALNLEVAGEVWYVRKADEWRVVATAAPKMKEILQGSDVKVRSWLPDPVDPEQPDSAVRAALEIAEEIRVMQALSRSQSRNRVAQRGILLVPKEGQFPDGDPFAATLHTAMTASIADEYAAAGVVPPVVDFPAEYIDKWKHLVLESSYDDNLDTKIDNAIRRLALSLNMPPEVLLGNIDSSHWNAWLSEESTYRAHVEPLAQLVAQVFAEAMMQAVDSAVEIVVTPDPSELLARRQSVADAFEALRLAVVGFAYVRKQMGADDDDAPTPDEVELILKLTGNAPQEVPALPEVGTDETGPPQLPEAAPDPLPNGNGNGTKPVAASVDASDVKLDRLARQLSDIDVRLLGKLEGLADMAIAQAREAVNTDEPGNQHAVAEEMQRLGRAWNRELTQARKVLASLGIDSTGQAWDEAQERSVHLLVDEMTAFVTDNLAKSDSEMPATPVLTLRQVLAVAGGSGSATVA